MKPMVQGRKSRERLPGKTELKACLLWPPQMSKSQQVKKDIITIWSPTMADIIHLCGRTVAAHYWMVYMLPLWWWVKWLCTHQGPRCHCPGALGPVLDKLDAPLLPFNMEMKTLNFSNTNPFQQPSGTKTYVQYRISKLHRYVDEIM